MTSRRTFITTAAAAGLGEHSVSILPDHQRRCAIVDPDDNHLLVSLGRATENLVHAAAAVGFRGDAVFAAGTKESIDDSLVRDTERRTLLFEATPCRQSTRAEFDAKPLANDEPRLPETAGSGNGARAHLLTDRQAMESMLDLRGGRAFPRFSP